MVSFTIVDSGTNTTCKIVDTAGGGNYHCGEKIAKLKIIQNELIFAN